MKTFLVLVAACFTIAAAGTRRGDVIYGNTGLHGNVQAVQYPQVLASHYSGSGGRGEGGHELARYAHFAGQGGLIAESGGLSAHPGGGIGLADVPTKVSKSVYVFSAPPDPFDQEQPQIVKRFPPQRQKHYQVVFINAPSPPKPAQHTVELPSPPELKTQIYVLVKKPPSSPPLKIVPAKVPVHKPEVFFIRYQNQNGGITPIPVVGPGGGSGGLISTDGGHVGPVEGYGSGGLVDPVGYGAPQPVIEDYNNSPVNDYGEPVANQYGPPVDEYQSDGYASPTPEYGAPVAPAAEYATSPDYGAPVSQYVSSSGAFGYDSASASGGGGGHENGDMYADYSRYRNRFTSLRGSRPSGLFSSRSWRKNSRSDTNSNFEWTPMITNKNTLKLNNNKEIDAGMSGI